MNTHLTIVHMKDGKLVANTKDLSELFGKRHDNVLRKIDAKLKDYSEEFNRLNFELVDYIDEKGESRRMYYLTRGGFTAIAMAFNGTKAGQFQEMVINEFERMARQLEALALPAGNTVEAYLSTLKAHNHVLEGTLRIVKTHELAINELKEKVTSLEAVKKPILRIVGDSRKVIDQAIDLRLSELDSSNLDTLKAIRGSLKRRFQVYKYYQCPADDAVEYIRTWTYGTFR